MYPLSSHDFLQLQRAIVGDAADERAVNKQAAAQHRLMRRMVDLIEQKWGRHMNLKDEKRFSQQSIKSLVETIERTLRVNDAENQLTEWFTADDASAANDEGGEKIKRNNRSLDVELLRDGWNAPLALMLAQVQSLDYYKRPDVRVRLLTSILNSNLPTKGSSGVPDQEVEDSGTTNERARSQSSTSTLPTKRICEGLDRQLDNLEQQVSIEPRDSQEQSKGDQDQRPVLNHGTHSSSALTTNKEDQPCEQRSTSDNPEKGKRPLGDNTGYPSAKRICQASEGKIYYPPCGVVESGTLLTLRIPAPSEKGQIHPWNTYHAVKFLMAVIKDLNSTPPSRVDPLYKYFDITEVELGDLQDWAKEMPCMNELCMEANASGYPVVKLLTVALPWEATITRDSIIYVVFTT
ncbi:hypothetical protein T440DRAFT_512342 [Plenodomus tracheiphilus IPT5]|uniref:Uncharacterized protein n=1 Tax=Plenodomus tracheiphilus IPT5 TaxID=1408161 RepID=A0A6A7AM17_9PLEO|nr:hypothetical protein T440DRAFT_512342 [Plenodomus tracheiphilus IPT5]